jgi:uncharacterized cofD-like protein
VSGRVIPASEEAGVLVATLKDGTVLTGEHHLDESAPNRSPIVSLTLESPLPASGAAMKAVVDADVIILGPGDLYASTLAPLLPEGMREALAASKAEIIYIANLFTKSGQTGGMSAKQHIQELAAYAGREPDRILIHTNGGFESSVLDLYAKEGESPVVDDLGEDPRVVRTSLASVHVVPPVPEDPVPRSLARHDPDKLAKALSVELA